MSRVLNEEILLSKKETSSLAGSEGSLDTAEPLMVLMVPSALDKQTVTSAEQELNHLTLNSGFK